MYFCGFTASSREWWPTAVFGAGIGVMVIDGSYLRRDGRLVLHSLSKVYLCATQKQGTLDVLLHGQPVINALLRASRQPAKVVLNGKIVDPTYNLEAQNNWLSVIAD